MTEPPDVEQARVIYDYIQALRGGKRAARPAVGRYEPFVRELEKALATGIPTAVENVYEAFKAGKPLFRRLIERFDMPVNLSAVSPIPLEATYVPPLPKAAHLPAELALAACPWLDSVYIPFSQHWAPRGYALFHEANGLWILSTIAARRVAFHFGGLQYTPLYLALVGTTTLHTKSTTTRIALRVLEAAGLRFLLGANITTPQKLLSSMAGQTVPPDYATLDEARQHLVRLRIGFAAQRGWFYEEFGMQLDQMVQKNGPMADFKGLLRVLDDCLDVYENDTHARGTETIHKPYLALLANMTPSDLRPYAGMQSKFWKDGLFARFAFLVAPHSSRKRDRYPHGEQRLPTELLRPLVAWHERLGIPAVTITTATNKAGEPTGHYELSKAPLPEQVYDLPPEVEDAFYTYEECLIDLAEESKNEVLYGTYGRLPIKALRIAALFASFANSPRIELRHWARAQATAERWRASLHELLRQVSEPEPSAGKQLEDRVCEAVQALGTPTAREVGLRVHESSSVTRGILEALAEGGEIVRIPTAQSCRYAIKGGTHETMQRQKV